MAYRRSAFRLCGTWCWIPHVAWGFLAGYLPVESGVPGAILSAVMVAVYVVYQFEETVVDMITGRRSAAEWDWPEEELRELMAGIGLGVVAGLA